MMGSYELQKSDKLFPIVHIVSKNTTAVPGNLLFYPYDPHPVWDASSNGMSCHITKAKALENALFELIERDAFALSWLLKS
jgi:ribosomal protein S12 methylthiotransferase accessory factor YcaO